MRFVIVSRIRGQATGLLHAIPVFFSASNTRQRFVTPGIELRLSPSLSNIMPQASHPFSSAVQADRPSPRESQPRELPLWRKQRGALPPPGFKQPHVSKRCPRPVAKRKQGEALLPPGFEHCQTSILGRMEMDNSAKFERFGHSFPNYGSGTPLRAQERVSMQKQPDGILRRETYKSFETRGSLQALCRVEEGVACFPGQGSTNASHPNFLEFQAFRSAASFLEMKTSFMDMWFKLEDTLQNHERVLVKMNEEIEKSSFDLKTAKEMALKEREELEAQSPGATKPLETVSEQARKAKRMREDFEGFSTDLSVQLAELNRIQQQVEEQQANLEALIKFKTHSEAQEKGKNVRFETGSIKNNLQESEARLAALQAELTGNRLASEQLEQAVLKGIAGLNQCDEVP